MRALPLMLLAACASEPSDGSVGPLAADHVRWAPGASDRAFGDPALAANGVRGGGASSGSTDVYSLRPDGDEAALALDWTDAAVFDQPGIDLVVFENPFEHPLGTFIDPVVVEVSSDGETWVAFPHDYLAPDELAWSADPTHWSGFAGLTPVLFHEKTNPVDPLDPSVAGGDAFDLADLPDDPETARIGELGACCVRLWSASAWINPDTDETYPKDPIGNGADIDGVYAAVDYIN